MFLFQKKVPKFLGHCCRSVLLQHYLTIAILQFILLLQLRFSIEQLTVILNLFTQALSVLNYPRTTNYNQTVPKKCGYVLTVAIHRR